MNVVQFPMKLRLTKSEYEQFLYLKNKMKNSITSREATWYKNELDALVAHAKNNIGIDKK